MTSVARALLVAVVATLLMLNGAVGLARRAHNAEVHRSIRCSAKLPNVKAFYEICVCLVQ